MSIKETASIIGEGIIYVLVIAAIVALFGYIFPTDTSFNLRLAYAIAFVALLETIEIKRRK